MFNGNLSEGTCVTIEGCAITPFVTVIKALYMPNGHLGWVKMLMTYSQLISLLSCRKVEDVNHLMEMFNVVER